MARIRCSLEKKFSAKVRKRGKHSETVDLTQPRPEPGKEDQRDLGYVICLGSPDLSLFCVNSSCLGMTNQRT